MSVFIMKLIAVTSMVIDHLGYFLFPRFTSQTVYFIMRSIGRTAFPIYCFLIVNGYEKTHDVKRYLSRLILFALVSQIPFVMCFDANPFPSGGGIHYALSCRWFVGLLMIPVVAVGWYCTVRKDASVLLPVLALTAGVSLLDFGGVRILSDELNVFYTLALGLSCVAVLDSALKPQRDMVKLLMQVLMLVCALYLIQNNADYRLPGVALIVCIWLARRSRLAQIAVILLWCVVEYILDSFPIYYFLCAALSILPVFLYNGKLGRPLKLAFYLIYPIHLFILGILTVHFTLV